MKKISVGSQQATEPSFLDKLRNALAAMLGAPHNGDATTETRREPHLADAGDDTVAPLTDPARLPLLSRRRLIIDWRDNTHVELMRTAQFLQIKAAHHIDAQMGQLGLMRKWIGASADPVLKGWLSAEVMQPLDACWKRERAKSESFRTEPTAARLRSSDFIFDTSVAWLGSDRFKPGNRDLLVEKVQEWLLGPRGVAAYYCRQASQMADALMQPEASC